MKRNLYKWHKRIGLTLGTVLFVLGLSGSVISFRDELLPVIYSDLFLVKSGTQRSEIVSVSENAKKYLNDRPMTHLYTSERDDTATMVFSKRAGSVLPDLITINPYTAEVIGEMPLIKNVFGVMLYVHANLLLGKVGGYLVGVMGVLLCGFFITGILIFWGPKLQERIKRLPKAGLRGVHRSAGLIFGMPLLFIGLTGFILAFDLLGSSSRPAEVIRSKPCEFSKELDVLKNLDANEAQNVISIHFCSIKNGLMKITSGHTERSGDEGFSRKLIDPSNGQIVQYFDSNLDPASWNRNTLLVYPLHTGSYFGLFGRIVIFISGFSLMSLYVTGLLISTKQKKIKHSFKTQKGLHLTSTRQDLA